jgi:hypothetical protein
LFYSSIGPSRLHKPAAAHPPMRRQIGQPPMLHGAGGLT